MPGQGRPTVIRGVALAFFGVAVASTGVVAGETKPQLRPLLEDAELADVCLLDQQRGWAVGDRGVIWHTTDGGKKWQLQPSGVECRLASVHFVDEKNGWAAGGTSLPYMHTSIGVLLRTRDGGQSWQAEKVSLPGIKQIRFFNVRQGWAVGDTSAMFPTGALVTDDGGRSWTPLGGHAVQGWLAGDFVDPVTGAAAGHRGSLAVVRRRALEATRTADLGLRGLQRLKLAPPVGGWLVGDGGLILTTQDLGVSWQLPPGDPTPAAGADFDWRAVEVRGPQCWIAGSPGSRVLHTTDGGRTWQSYSTGQTMPIHAIQFIDDRQGWAVGALGTILATIDGGKTWKRQHAGGSRAALFAVFSEPQAAPLELFARLSGSEGYLSAVEFLNRRDQQAGQSANETLADRAHAALVTVGCSAVDTAWSFPLEEAGLSESVEKFVDRWNRANDGQGIERLEARLVRQIRQWRPEVVVTHAASPRGDDPLGHVINQLVLRAAERAADGTRFPEHLTQLGLEPWKVKKVIGSLSDGRLGAINVTTSQLAPRFGCSLADLCETPRGLVLDRYTAAPATLGFQLLIDAAAQTTNNQDFFSGITLYPGDARRSLSDLPDQTIDLMRRVAQKHRNLQAILAHSSKSPQASARLIAQIGDLTTGLDESSAGDLLFQLGQHYHAVGQREIAAEAFDALVNKYPTHALAPAALAWQLNYWSSSEVAWQQKQKNRAGGAQTVTQVANTELTPPLGQVLPASGNTTELLLRRQQATLQSTPGEPDRTERALAAARRIEQFSPALFVEPSVQFPLSVVWRQRGVPKSAEKFYLNFSRSRPHDTWWSCAAGEQWLNDPKSEPPKPVWRALRSGAKPRLDGRIDEPIWQGDGIELRSVQRDDSSWPAKMWLAYDEAFLYVAVSCRRPAGAVAPPTKQPRPRDPDLSAQDRVELLLDLDRDWSTYYRLAIDQRGWATDDCWGDKSWNPQWFVAVDRDEESWTAEAAIPLDELTSEPPKSRHAWAIGIQRINPGVGFQSWTQPASTTGAPEGFGYLIFD